jgi:hypothetical protein
MKFDAGELMNSRIRVCSGKDCHKHKKRCKALIKNLDSCAETGTIQCQDICKGLVVVMDHEGERLWLKQMGGKKARKTLRNFLARGHMSKRLKKRVVRMLPQPTSPPSTPAIMQQ